MLTCVQHNSTVQPRLSAPAGTEPKCLDDCEITEVYVYVMITARSALMCSDNQEVRII